jgi:recombination protein RecA
MRAQVEALLREKKLDRTLTSAMPAPSALSREERLLATGWSAVDQAVGGGFPRGECSEIVGSPSSGRTALLGTLLTQATRRGEIVALVDTLDRFDPQSAAELTLDLSRLLWVRGTALSPQALSLQATARRGRGGGRPRRGEESSEPELLSRVIDRALKAFGLIAQAGGFGIVALDLADVPMPALRRLPFTTWFRLQRLVEGSQTVGVLLAPEPLGRSARGVTVRLGADDASAVIWTGNSHQSRLLTGFALRPQVHCARRLEDALQNANAAFA